MANRVFKNIPSVNELLESPQLRGLVDKVSHTVVVSEVRSFLDALRGEIQTAAEEMNVPAPSELAERIAKWIVREQRPRLQPVINATGILLHTGLGRAPLAQRALDNVALVAGGYASVEVDLETGGRSQRIKAVESLLKELTGAEAAAVVNNNAGATLLTLAALAGGREVVVSRGELIEIGGSYRLPDVMKASGAILHEVGTTNKTRISDYAQACSENTAALMRAHTSNYRIVGFTEAPTTSQLVSLAAEKGVIFIDDIGSGAFIDFSAYGLEDEPIAAESIRAGADAVLFSGDKLLGGPQCGVIIGRRKYIDRIVKNPLMRALRVDKMTLAALDATLRLYRNPQQAIQQIPLLAMVSTSIENLHNRADRLAPQLAAAAVIETAEPVEDTAQLGGGSVPAQDIPTWCVALTPHGISVDELAKSLRMGKPPVVGRVSRDRLLLDLRTVLPEQDSLLVDAAVNIGKQPDEDD